MAARVQTHLTSSIFVSMALLLSGCASSSDFTVPMPDIGLSMPASEAPMVEVAEGVAYGEPPVVPAGFGGGPQAVADSDGPYLLDTGDRLRVFVYGQPNLSRGYTVDHEGKITVPLIGSVHSRGLTTRDLEASIAAKLGSEFVRDPQVTVDVQQNRPFFIHGEVKTAGQYPYVSGMTVETAVAIAGGLSDRGSTRKFRITRRTNGFVEQIIAPADYVVKPGDTVFVYERFF
ncbi:MAG: sugar transporter [Hyphomicrobium sp. 32-62-53]|nr:MAG: sugar transporter [Hyphomicrobium sp. 12-62-95]OYX99878.1 MAG: sugar transporter [Hyphomicrobium sp. 32-62-53]